jgi:hypothetical protein
MSPDFITVSVGPNRQTASVRRLSGRVAASESTDTSAEHKLWARRGTPCLTKDARYFNVVRSAQMIYTVVMWLMLP